MSECIFCAIVSGEAEGDIIYRDEDVTAFRDINPVAPTHILIVPNRHVNAITELEESDLELLGRIVLLAPKIAQQAGIVSSGYRLSVNQGRDAGQIVDHLHWHVIGGAPLGPLG